MSFSTQQPVLSVIIPAYNEEDFITATLSSVFAAAAHVSGQVEVIVVDNNSSDRTGAIAAECGAKVIFEPKNQIARARNTGGKVAQGQCLVFVDADTLLEGDILAKAAANIAGGEIIGGGAWVEPDSTGPGKWLFKYGLNNLLALRNVTVGPFLYCEREAFLRVGGFDETLYAAEEFALADSLKAEGKHQGKQWHIIKFHPDHRIITSSRRFGRFGGLEMAFRNAHLLWRPQLKLRDKDACKFWYEARNSKRPL